MGIVKSYILPRCQAYNVATLITLLFNSVEVDSRQVIYDFTKKISSKRHTQPKNVKKKTINISDAQIP